MTDQFVYDPNALHFTGGLAEAAEEWKQITAHPVGFDTLRTYQAISDDAGKKILDAIGFAVDKFAEYIGYLSDATWGATCGLLAAAQGGLIPTLPGEKLTEIHHGHWGTACHLIARGMAHIFEENWGLKLAFNVISIIGSVIALDDVFNHWWGAATGENDVKSPAHWFYQHDFRPLLVEGGMKIGFDVFKLLSWIGA